MFPIYDPQGRVIAFGGRVIGAGEPKYLNSAESPTFQKGSTLYGLNWAKNAIRKDERVLLVEGYFDCVRLLAAGIESTVAPLGTALTEAQAELLRKYTTTVFLLHDSDRAGRRSKRGGTRARATPGQGKVVAPRSRANIRCRRAAGCIATAAEGAPSSATHGGHISRTPAGSVAAAPSTIHRGSCGKPRRRHLT